MLILLTCIGLGLYSLRLAVFKFNDIKVLTVKSINSTGSLIYVYSLYIKSCCYVRYLMLE